MKILVLRDDKPGHYHQSKAIVMALRKLGPVEDEWIIVPKRGLLPQQTLRAIAAGTYLPASISEFVSGTKRLNPLSKPDLIVSAGGKTLPHLVLLARRFQCQSLFSGSIRNIPADRFTALIHHFRSYAHLPNCVVTLKPSPVDATVRKTLPAMGAVSENGYVALLVGAPTKARPFIQDDWQAILGWLQTSLKDRNWVVTTSRRTPDSWTRDLHALADNNKDRLTFLDYTKTGPGDAVEIMLGAQQVYVTSDSDSMVSEAIACQKPVIALLSETSDLREQIKYYYEDLVEQNLLAFVPCSGLSATDLASVAQNLTPMQGNYLEELGRLLATKLSLPADFQV